jgi:tetratricopeptide (TPR) repeat protein
MNKLLVFFSCVALAACGGSSKKADTTPKAAGSGSGSSSDPTAMQNTAAPDVPANGGGSDAVATSGDAAGGGSGSAVNNAPQQPPIIFPNQDPDPAQVKSQVDQHLNAARAALTSPTPQPDTALAEAREALKLDAANIDAAGMVAFAYYHKKQYDTAELILDDIFKRPAAKENAEVYYVYGLVYDATNRSEQAVLAYQKSLAINPNLQSAQINLGVHQLQNKQYADAQATFEKLTGAGKNDAVTLTSLGSSYRGRSGDYPPGSTERNDYITKAEASYKKALSVDPNYGPAYYNTAMLYLDSDPFPSGGGTMDTMQRLNASKTYLEMYQKSPGFDPKLVDQRMKEIEKSIKRAEKAAKKAKKGGGGAGGNP